MMVGRSHPYQGPSKKDREQLQLALSITRMRRLLELIEDLKSLIEAEAFSLYIELSDHHGSMEFHNVTQIKLEPVGKHGMASLYLSNGLSSVELKNICLFKSLDSKIVKKIINPGDDLTFQWYFTENSGKRVRITFILRNALKGG